MSKPKEKLRTVNLDELKQHGHWLEPDYKPMDRKCTDCGKPFSISVSEQKFFQEKKFDLPKRCKPCRQIRRQNNISVNNSK